MINGLKPYSFYKDSGVPWLGQIPSHWESRKLGQIGSLSKGNGGSKEDEVASGVPCVRYGDLYTTHRCFIVKSRSLISPDRADLYTSILFGDVLFAASGETLDEIGKSAENLLDSEAFCGGDIIVFRPNIGLAPRYMGYAADCHPCAAQKASMGRGITVKHIYADQIKYLSIPLPPVPEQSAIVRFLDHADWRIQRYIGAKKKLIALLNEQKQAIIQRAVTRGLDPDVRLKPSGVEWLGKVPEHWEVSQIRSLAYVVRGSSPRPAGSALYFHGTGMPWITVGEITKDSGMHLTSTATRLTPAGEECSRTIDAGTLLLTNSGATLGVPKISLIQGCINDGVAALLRLRVSREFLFFFLTTQTAHLKAWVSLGAQPNLNTQIIGGWPALVPPAAEQNQIVEYVAQETATLMRALEKAHDEVALLQEYRTRLIADVVTGKVDVREAATRLPEEAEELELLDEGEAMGEDEAEGLDEVSEEILA